MISFDDAFRLMMQHTATLGVERVPLASSMGRILAEPLVSDVDMPPFNRAAMDGYACRRTDLNQPLRRVGIVAAGAQFDRPIIVGECVRIMTGAPLPDGANCVFIIEESTEDATGIVHFTGKNSPDNFVPRGEDIQCGTQLLSTGMLLQPSHIAAMASIGQSHPLVFKQPKVGVITTGDELVSVDEVPTGAKIRNSNGPQLMAQLSQLGVMATDYGQISDKLDDIKKTVARATAENDLVLLSGGVSVGDFDFGDRALKESGYLFEFERVAMQPGKPTMFGHQPGKWCFGLPGNPVSTYMVFEIMVKPFVYRLMGHEFRPKVISVRLGETITRKKTKRQAALPVRFVDPTTVVPLTYHGSAHINSLMVADAFVTLPMGCVGFNEGEVVTVQLL